MRSNRPIVVLVLAFLSVVAVACSGDLSSSPRARMLAEAQSQSDPNATGIPGANTDPLDIDAFCGVGEARNSTSEINGYMVASCFILDNRTSVFTAPGVISDAEPNRLPLTVHRFSAVATGSGSLLGAYQPGGASGVVTGERVGSSRTALCGQDRNPPDATACAGRLTPNPFRGTAAMGFEQSQPWEGTVNKLEISAMPSPFDRAPFQSPFFELDQTPAKISMNNTWTGEPTVACTNGRYIACSYDSGLQPKIHGGHQRPRFSFTTWPLRVSIQNAMTSQKKFSIRPLVDADGQNLLREPKADTVLPIVNGNVIGVPPGATLEYGGYRMIGGVVVWQGLFELVDANGGTSCNGCGTVVTITVKVDPRPPAEGKKEEPYAGSSCEVMTMGTVSLSCDTPVFSGSPRGQLTATINIKDF